MGTGWSSDPAIDLSSLSIFPHPSIHISTVLHYDMLTSRIIKHLWRIQIEVAQGVEEHCLPTWDYLLTVLHFVITYNNVPLRGAQLRVRDQNYVDHRLPAHVSSGIDLVRGNLSIDHKSANRKIAE